MLSIPIVSSFDGSGIAKAKKEFAQLDGAAAKTKRAFQKAMIPAAAAVGALGLALFDATKGAMEDAAAQELLAKALKNNTKATDAQIAANEEWISTQGRLFGITDDELRPAIAGLARATGSVTEAQKAATLAMDISAGKGVSLETVTKALERAYGGNLNALKKLSPEVGDMIKDGASLEEVMAELGDTFGGSAATAAETAEGKFKKLKVSLDETKESVGEALLPAVEELLPILEDFAKWAEDNPKAFKIVAGAILGIAAAVFIVNGAIAAYSAAVAVATAAQWLWNAAVSANPIVLIGLAIIALIAGIVLAYNKFEGFKNLVDTIGNALKTGFLAALNAIKGAIKGVGTVFKTLFNGIAKLWNNTFGKLSFKVPSWVPVIGGKGFDVPDIPMLAAGGIVTGPTLAMIGEAGPEAVVPLSRAGEFGMGGGGVNITIQTGVGDPVAIGREVRRVMDAYGRRAA
jgi:hypothetical protein